MSVVVRTAAAAPARLAGDAPAHGNGLRVPCCKVGGLVAKIEEGPVAAALHELPP